MGLVSNIAASGTPRPNVEAEHSIRVVVIDDSSDYRTVICELLQMLFDVEIVGVGSNGFEAIELTAQTAPDLVIMDVHMPVLDGLEATRRIKADPRGKETMVVTLTASAMDDDRHAVMQSGADGFLSKPLREEDLLEKIRILLNIAYVYEELNGAEGRPLSDGAPQSAESLDNLPLVLLNDLLNATLDGNKKLLDKLIRKVRATGAREAADALQGLADHYAYDSLTRLLEEACRQ